LNFRVRMLLEGAVIIKGLCSPGGVLSQGTTLEQQHCCSLMPTSVYIQ